MMTQRGRALVIAAGALLVAVIAGWLWILREPGKPAPVGVTSGSPPSNDSASPQGAAKTAVESTRKSRGSSLHPWTVALLSENIAGVLGVLRRQEPAAIREALAQLEADLSDAPPDIAIGAIQAFLATRQDAATGEIFALRAGGRLETSPTLRVFLLDQLGALACPAGSPAAGEVGREILLQANSADEWALSMRNVAWSDASAGKFLSAKIGEMLRHQPWVEAPTIGFLESFDVVVFTQATEQVPRLVQFIESDVPMLQRAGAVALDRLAETAPLATMQKLNANPQLLADTPLVRADYFAKADLAEPGQRRAVDDYLQRADVSLEEKTKMFAVYLTPGSFLSPNLLTAPISPESFDPIARLATLQQIALEWGSRFPELKDPLAEAIKRASE